MDAETQALLQEVSREIAAGLARLKPATAAGLTVDQLGPVLLIRPVSVAEPQRREGQRQRHKGFYAS